MQTEISFAKSTINAAAPDANRRTVSARAGLESRNIDRLQGLGIAGAKADIDAAAGVDPRQGGTQKPGPKLPRRFAVAD